VKYIKKPKEGTEYAMLEGTGMGYGGVRGTMQLEPGDPRFDVQYKVYCTVIHVLKVCSFLKILIESLINHSRPLEV